MFYKRTDNRLRGKNINRRKRNFILFLDRRPDLSDDKKVVRKCVVLMFIKKVVVNLFV